ncbi:MAG: SPOR domain-containing protein [Muribaculaceae bacterium]|nr:SPOR domain-containing protein [Muribaculaceae bacterium]
MKFRHLIISAIISVTVSPAFAEGSTDSCIIDRVEQSGRISVICPAALVARLQPAAVSESEVTVENELTATVQPNTHVGYRVQVFDDNNVNTAKQEAQSRRQLIQSRFPELRTYVQFNSPYWRVKVGDFKTRSEAETTMLAIRQAFPSIASQLRVVRDRINP